MSRQDKATTERNARTLRELIKRPENKVCADCKRNDPRWASWNLGVFVCIRCSGIHRSMGTHISKVKSVDLDMWTPEQMKNVQNWGNERANLYWEAHLKPGHIPPDHKVESFIRSKYESRRWAMEGPPPADPSVLDGGRAEPEPAPPPAPAIAPPSGASTPSAALNSNAAPAVAGTAARRSQARTLLSADTFTPPSQPRTQAPAAAAAPPPPQQAPKPSAANDLFSLDFTPPTSTPTGSSFPNNTTNNTGAAKNKNDILSLFSQAPPASAVPAQNAFGAPTVTATPTSFVGQNGSGMWGASSGWAQPAQPAVADPWGSFATAAPATAPPVSSGFGAAQVQGGGFGAFGGAPQQQQQQPLQAANVWGAPAVPQQPQSANAFGTNVWGAPASANGAGGGGAFDLFATPAANAAAADAKKKDDAFGDLWGGFK